MCSEELNSSKYTSVVERRSPSIAQAGLEFSPSVSDYQVLGFTYPQHFKQQNELSIRSKGAVIKDGIARDAAYIPVSRDVASRLSVVL